MPGMIGPAEEPHRSTITLYVHSARMQYVRSLFRFASLIGERKRRRRRTTDEETMDGQALVERLYWQQRYENALRLKPALRRILSVPSLTTV